MLAFHRGLPGYAPTALHSLPREAAALGLGALLLKDENGRFGLPAFKICGASWALERLLAAQPRPAHACGRRARATTAGPSRARPRSAGCGPHLPARAHERGARRAIAGEGAEVVRVAGGYEQAVAAAAEAGRSPARRRSRTSPTTLRSGRELGLRRLLDDLRGGLGAGGGPFDVVLCQMGVGSSPPRHPLCRHQTPPAVAIGVEPVTAACVLASLEAGRPVVIDTPGTSMAGLNCATPSHAAWPALRDGLTGCVTVSDDEAHGHARSGRSGHRRRRLRRGLPGGPARARARSGVRRARAPRRASAPPAACCWCRPRARPIRRPTPRRWRHMRLDDAAQLAESLATAAPEPAAGIAICTTGAMAAALVAKACALSPAPRSTPRASGPGICVPSCW